MNIYAGRIKTLQDLMKKHHLDAFIILSTDIHGNEYLPKCFAHRAFISGFTGSAGTLVVLKNSAHLFTDGRYWLQAQKELLGSDITLQKQSSQHTYPKFLSKILKNGAFVGINAHNVSMHTHKELKKEFKTKNLKLKYIDLITPIYAGHSPLPQHKIFEHHKAFTSSSVKEKLTLIRQKMSEQKATHHFVSSLDDIAWITNLRGLDIEYNPVFLSFLLIDQKNATLFVDIRKIEPKLTLKLQKQGFSISEYESVDTHLSKLKKACILLDANKTSVHFAKILKQGKNKLIKALNPSTLLKAHKNAKELKHIKNAMISDGIALCEFFAWFEKAVRQGIKLNELDIDTKITAFRAKNPLYLCNSFATIAGFNAHSALVHYQARAQNCSQIQKDGILLIDSGAQYQNGTTDITRVISTGRISKSQKRDYTLVLKALITLSKATFPKNIALNLLDAFARADLWQEGLEYMHGTGHGVGYVLNVHEMPIIISHFSRQNTHSKANIGVVSSIEPGIYRKDKWGIRLENLVSIVKANTKEKGFGEFLHFETLTLCPFEHSLIDFSMLDSAEKSWLNSYHQKVFKMLAPHLKGEALAWLKRKTQSSKV